MLTHRFADELPELTVAWQAAEAPEPRLLVLNRPLATELGLDPGWLAGPDGVGLLVGTQLPPGAQPVAQAYAGHQFGGYSPRLGDGRALLLGEIGNHDLHLKGSGRTPFSRGGDGYAVVGPMLREHLISEATHALGIPTTRSLAVVATGRPVQRETVLPGAVLARIASSHLRVGSFQYAAATEDRELLQRLADHAIARHEPDAKDALELYSRVVDKQARLVAQWMLVGFVHGVMNTDNMTISGETIDYGPCAFLDAFDPATVFSSIDTGGRYAFGNQPPAAEWNLTRLAEAMLPLFHDDQGQAVELATEALAGFRTTYAEAWTAGISAKLGVASAPDELTDDLLRLMHENRVDHTNLFRSLAKGDARELFLDLAGIDAWLARWHALDPDTALMNRTNPAYIPRNHLVEEALTAATSGDMEPLDRLLEVLARPYDERPGLERYTQPGEGEGYQTFCGT